MFSIVEACESSSAGGDGMAMLAGFDLSIEITSGRDLMSRMNVLSVRCKTLYGP